MIQFKFYWNMLGVTLATLMAFSFVVPESYATVTVRQDRIQGVIETSTAAEKGLTLRLRDGSIAAVHVSETTWYHAVRALDGQERQPDLASLFTLPPKTMLSVSGLVYSDRNELVAKEIVVFGNAPGTPVLEAADWWSAQARELSRFWVRAQSENPELNLDPAKYRTRITKSGSKRPEFENIQETDTISRLVYGLSSTYIITGETWALEGASRLVDYQRRMMRYVTPDGRQVYWAHAVKDGKRILASQFSDDQGSIPLYEQIYALTGLTQYYRATADSEILSDITRTIAFMDAHYWDSTPKDPLTQGYFSHADPATFNPGMVAERNRLKKNWNSVGDHLPAYLMDLYLGTGNPAYLKRLSELGALIVAHFPDPNSPFVFERFNQDWSPDLTYSWQQNRAVIGHNLKIAWILTRLHFLTGDNSLIKAARECADKMMVYGEDLRRGGWYDVIERVPDQRTGRFELTWHDRKAWWQQEQGILANYVLFGATGSPSYLDTARAGSAFYNTAFPDHDDGEVYFDVQGDGTPYVVGDRSDKGSHSKSGYHSMELTYFAHLYTNLMVAKRDVGLNFRPLRAEQGQVLRVQPVSFPKGSVRLSAVTIDGKTHKDFDAGAMTIELPKSDQPLNVVAVLSPVGGR